MIVTMSFDSDAVAASAAAAAKERKRYDDDLYLHLACHATFMSLE